MTRAELEAAVKLARVHLNGGDDESYPECQKCNTLMEREPDHDSTALCASCCYDAMDAVSAALLAMSSRLAAVEAVVAAAERLSDVLSISEGSRSPPSMRGAWFRGDHDHAGIALDLRDALRATASTEKEQG